MAKAPKTVVKYRDAGDGQFITRKEFDRRPPDKVIKERVPTPGNGDTK